MDVETTHPLNAVELQKSCPTSASCSSSTSSSTPVQVVKPTLRQDKDVSSAPCHSTIGAKASDSYSAVGVATGKGIAGSDVGCTSTVAEESQHGECTEPEDDSEFEWNEYLDATGATAAPPTSFAHVECSLQNLFTKDMKVEVPNRPDDGTYWVASIIMPCGPLLRLRYEGYGEDRSADFWCEIALRELRPVGYCAENNKLIQPPPAIREKLGASWPEYLRSALNGATNVPGYLLDTTGCTAVDLIKQGMKLEVQDLRFPINTWIASVIKNVGGRLLLRYDGIDNSSLDFWLFYLSFRLHPVGWARHCNYQYKPPSAYLPMHTTQEWAQVLRESLQSSPDMPVPSIVFRNQEKIVAHNFKIGMKLEAVHPSNLLDICPATISKYVNSFFFEVEIDEFHNQNAVAPSVKFCCHANSWQIFEIGWAKSNGISITAPKGWNKDEFDWPTYLESTKNFEAKRNWNQEIAPINRLVIDHGLEQGMKLEAVNPFQPNELCAATITKVAGNLIWLHMDNSPGTKSNHIVPANSYDLFPVGWCDSNHYPLKIPVLGHQEVAGASAKKVAIVIPKKQKRKLDDMTSEEACELYKGARDNQATGKAWCSEIYVNHKCFSGLLLSKARIAGLPKHVGPGPVTLVLKEILSLIVSVSYIPSRALAALQLHGEPGPGMQPQLIKAKYKGRTFSTTVEIVRNSDKVAEFCQSVCRKLQCCPNLFGPVFFGEECPENCYSLTKTTKPVMKRGKKRRKNKMHHLQRPQLLPKTSTEDTRDQDACETSNEKPTEPPREKRKYNRRTVLKSDIVTRGAKLPNFALQLRRRRHKSAGRTYLTLLNKSIHHKSQSPLKTASAANIVRGPIGRPRKSAQLSNLPSAVRVLHLKEPLTFPKQSTNTFSTVFTAPADKGAARTSSVDLAAPSLMVRPAKETFHLESNPIRWSIDEVCSFIKRTDCAPMARLLKEQEIDGQALLLLTLPTVQEHLELKLGPAIKLCHHIERIKTAFYSQYATEI